MGQQELERLLNIVLNKFEESLTASSVALFHQTLVRECRKEVLDICISKTIQLLKECNIDWTKDNQDVLNLFPEGVDLSIQTCLVKVETNLKEYVYKSSVYELIP